LEIQGGGTPCPIQLEDGIERYDHYIASFLVSAHKVKKCLDIVDPLVYAKIEQASSQYPSGCKCNPIRICLGKNQFVEKRALELGLHRAKFAFIHGSDQKQVARQRKIVKKVELV
jgi:hypothetical protein